MTTANKVDAPFDSAAWHGARDDRIKASRTAGHIHLDRLDRDVETLRGKKMYCVHDPKEQGVIRTVLNTGNVLIHWLDKYSANKNLATPRQYGKTIAQESWLAPSDLKDYVAGVPPVMEQISEGHDPAPEEADPAESNSPGM